MVKSEYFNVKNGKAIMAEFLGTMILVFVGLGSCLNWTHSTDHDQLIRIGLSFGLVLAAIIYAFGPISGAHVNPAVTLGFVIASRIKGWLGAVYILFQFIGGIAGAGLLYALQAETYSGKNATRFGLTTVNKDLSVEQGLSVEFILTFVFVLMILLITDKMCEDFSRGSVAIGIGFALLSMELGFINATGGSLNPARSFGPALIVLHFEQLWVYIVGPIFGGALAGIIYRLFTYEEEEKNMLDGGAQTGAGDTVNPDNSNALFVSSDINTPSYDEITIDDDVKGKK